jgi:hypothetical protein
VAAEQARNARIIEVVRSEGQIGANRVAVYLRRDFR